MDKTNTEFDRDGVLNDFLCRYLDQKMDGAEKSAFEEYLSENEEERTFARRAAKGKRALEMIAEKLESAGH